MPLPSADAFLPSADLWVIEDAPGRHFSECYNWICYRLLSQVIPMQSGMGFSAVTGNSDHLQIKGGRLISDDQPFYADVYIHGGWLNKCVLSCGSPGIAP